MEEVVNVGEKALVCRNNGKQGKKLDKLRHCRFWEKTFCSAVAVEQCTLLPTSAAAKQHCLRVYHQVQVWMGHGMKIHADQWDWKINEGKML